MITYTSCTVQGQSDCKKKNSDFKMGVINNEPFDKFTAFVLLKSNWFYLFSFVITRARRGPSYKSCWDSVFSCAAKCTIGNVQCFIGQCTLQRTWRCFHWSMLNRKHVPSSYVFTD